MTTTRQQPPRRNRFSRNTVAADIRERIRELEKRMHEENRFSSGVNLNWPRIDELKRLLKRLGLEKP